MRISDCISNVCSSDLVERYAVFFRPTLQPRVDTSLGFGELALSAFFDLLGVPSRVNGATRPVTARRAAINSRASAGRRNDPTARAAGDVTMHCSWYSLGPLAGGGRVSEASRSEEP